MERNTIIVFTGSGASADSGVATFRDNGGLWNEYKVEDVATPEGFRRNPQLVWDFYKMRHDELKRIVPNEAHHAIAKLQCIAEAKGFNFILATQNVDRLHQRAGSTNVHELHGNLNDLKCSKCDFISTSHSEHYWKSETIPHCPACGEYLRPQIVWFGEALNSVTYDTPLEAAENCHSLLVVGTSMAVFPAANIANRAAQLGAQTYESNLFSEMNAGTLANFTFIEGRASEKVPGICATIQKTLIETRRN